MQSRLSCWSFHSVKGGVGKSTLATLAAVQLAHDNPDELVWLVDMDLTGTSLADVLPLRAPNCELLDDGYTLDLKKPAKDYLSAQDSVSAMVLRDGATGWEPIGIPFLNDHLMFATEDWDEEDDVHIDALAWRPAGATAPSNLRVLPSSALPRDLERILPIIFDEEHAAFLENRLEYLLAAMVSPERTTHVVFDVPPTIPGLSRGVLSLALRLGRGGEKTPLSLDGGFPDPLETTPISWRAVMIATQDIQDIRALARWLYNVGQEEESVFRVLINRAPEQMSSGQRRRWLEELATGRELLHSLLEDMHWLPASPELELFRRSELPAPNEAIAKLLEHMEPS